MGRRRPGPRTHSDTCHDGGGAQAPTKTMLGCRRTPRSPYPVIFTWREPSTANRGPGPLSAAISQECCENHGKRTAPPRPPEPRPAPHPHPRHRCAQARPPPGRAALAWAQCCMKSHFLPSHPFKRHERGFVSPSFSCLISCKSDKSGRVWFSFQRPSTRVLLTRVFRNQPNRVISVSVCS